jgi:hypothetical protein
MTEGDLFMPPPQEGAIGLAVTFFERLTYSFEVAVLMFDAPDEFPNLVPHNYTVVKFGVEYRLPFRKTGRELAMRFGVSRSFMDPGNDETIFTTESTGVYFGWGVQVDPLARFDAYFTVQIPGEGDVDDDLFLASVSYGMTF